MAVLDQIELPNGTTYDIQDNQPAVLNIPNTPTQIATFSGASNLPLSSLKVSVTPYQDLHGYDAPWAGGAGKNKFDIDAEHTSASGSATYTYELTLKPNTAYTMSSNVPQGNPASLYFNGGATNVNGVWSGTSRTFTSDENGKLTAYVRFNTAQGGVDLYTAVKNGTYYIQLEEGSTATAYAPYSNICPIIGWDKAVVNVSPLNIASLYNGQIYGDGSWVSSDKRLTNTSSAQDNSYFLKAGTYTLDYDKLNSNAPSLLQCSALTKDDNYTIIDNFAETWNKLPFTFTLTQDGYLYFTIRKDADTNVNPSDYRAKILGQTYTIDLDGTRYGGVLDATNGVLTVTYAKIALADIGKSKYATYQYGVRTITNFFDSIPNSSLLTGMSNTFVLSNSNESYDVDRCSILFGSGSAKTSILISTQASGLSADASITEIDEWLRSIDAYIVYPLATPITVQLAPQPVKSIEGENNISANCGQITEVKYVVSKYNGMTAKISEVAQFAKTANKQVPEIHRKYESTSYYATTASQADSTWYFMSVKPDNWYKPWKVKFKVHTYCPNYPSYESITWSTFTGREQSLSYANFNERYDSAHYYISSATLKKAGFDAGYGHALGVSILYGGGYTTAAYYRTFEVDYYECENCTVTILDSPTKLANWNGYSSTNYNSVANYDAINRGLRETSDDNDGHYYSRRIYSNIKAGSNKIFPYTIIMQNADGRWESLVTSNSTGTSKTRNTHGFRLNQILYMSANATYNENAVVGTYAVNEFFGNLLDHRYSFNTANDSTNGTTANTPIYLVGSINATDGLFYLDTKWWTQTLPTSDDGKLYIYIGDAYDYYRMTYSSNHPIYWYKGGKLQEYSQSANYAISAGTAASASSVAWSNVNNKPTIPTVTDTYSATGTAATSGKAVAAALGTLDGTVSGTAGAGKTLTAFSQTDGKVSATFGNISITKSQVSDFPTSMTPTSHTHGNIQNGGTLQTNDITIASGDKLVVTDSSDSSKVARTSVSFDGSTANKCLTQKGTWESFTNNTGTVTSVKVGSTSYSPSSGVVSLPAYPTTLPASDTTSTYSATGTAPVNGTAVAAALATISGGIVPSAYCDTAAGTAAKTATCTGYTLTTGNYIQVIIKNANSYNGAITLAINSTTAKPIYINGTASSSSNKTLPAGSYEVYYDGTAYQFRTDSVLPGAINEVNMTNNTSTGDHQILFRNGTATTSGKDDIGVNSGFLYNSYYGAVTIGTRASNSVIGMRSVAQGLSITASGENSHAEGFGATASGAYSHAEGVRTKATRESHHVFGEYNIEDSPSGSTVSDRGTYIEIVGNGTSSGRSNARTLDWSGNQWIAGNYSDTNGLLAMKEVTQAQYDALTTDEKNNGTAYFITDRLSPAATDLWTKVGTATLTTTAQNCSAAINELNSDMTDTHTTTELLNVSGINAMTTATSQNLSEAFTNYEYLVIQLRAYNNVYQTTFVTSSYFNGTGSGTRPILMGFNTSGAYLGAVEVYKNTASKVYIKASSGNTFGSSYRIYIVGVMKKI